MVCVPAAWEHLLIADELARRKSSILGGMHRYPFTLAAAERESIDGGLLSPPPVSLDSGAASESQWTGQPFLDVSVAYGGCGAGDANDRGNCGLWSQRRFAVISFRRYILAGPCSIAHRR
jgi:hypothetical protein